MIKCLHREKDKYAELYACSNGFVLGLECPVFTYNIHSVDFSNPTELAARRVRAQDDANVTVSL